MRKLKRFLANVALVTFFIFTAQLFLEPVAKAKWFEDEIDPFYLALAKQGLDELNSMRTLQSLIDKVPSPLKEALELFLHSKEALNSKSQEEPQPGFTDLLIAGCRAGIASGFKWLADRDSDDDVELDERQAALMSSRLVGRAKDKARQQARATWQCIDAHMIEPAKRRLPDMPFFPKLILQGTLIMAGERLLAQLRPTESGIPAIQFGESDFKPRLDELYLDLTHPTAAKDNLFNLVATLEATPTTEQASLLSRWLGVQDAEAAPGLTESFFVLLLVVAAIIIAFLFYGDGIDDDSETVRFEAASSKLNYEKLQLKDRMRAAFFDTEGGGERLSRRVDGVTCIYLTKLREFLNEHATQLTEEKRRSYLESFKSEWLSRHRHLVPKAEYEFAKILLTDTPNRMFYESAYARAELKELFATSTNPETRRLIEERVREAIDIEEESHSAPEAARRTSLMLSDIIATSEAGDDGKQPPNK